VEGATTQAKACCDATIGSLPERPILGYGVLGVTLSGGKRRGISGRPHLGSVGREEVATRSRNGELLFLKPGDGVGDAPVVLRLRLSFPRWWSSSGNLLRCSSWRSRLRVGTTLAVGHEESDN
jgi:hypothetical protein